jgi:Nif-specific regulatory protein
MTTADRDVDLLAAERDLYRRLLDLGDHDDIGAFLDDALSLVVDAVGARRAYLALDPVSPEASGYSAAKGYAEGDIASLRREISSGVLAEALRTGRTISTASALDDPRFQGNASVQANRIQAVLCAPIGAVSPIGALYLQGRAAPGPFSAKERQLAEAFAARVAPLAQRLRRAAPAARVDHTAELRARLSLDGIVGSSRALADTLRHVAVAAPVDIPVLIVGESGTGKTEIARALHANSRRARGPFVEINCAALPETLLEAELFGAEKGAHSTATRKILGKIAAAQGGTLFLDEVGELPLASQPKLLQFLQSRSYWPLGAERPVEADVRVVAATNADLDAAVKARRFREDLYYRLDVLKVRVAPLRERVEDIPAIAEHVARTQGAAMGRAMGVTRAAVSALRGAEWPGNVRQLAAAVQRGIAFALGDGSAEVDAHHVFPERAAAEPEGPLTWQEATRRFQRRLLDETLAQCNGNVSEAARRLELARSHMHELLRAHGLSRAKP